MIDGEDGPEDNPLLIFENKNAQETANIINGLRDLLNNLKDGRTRRKTSLGLRQYLFEECKSRINHEDERWWEDEEKESLHFFESILDLFNFSYEYTSKNSLIKTYVL